MGDSMKELYSKEVMKYFFHPKNVGKIENPDGIGKVGNIQCGDIMHLYIKINNNKIKDIKFETFGCIAAIATSSYITELVKGKTIEEAMKITRDDIIKGLGGLPPIKIHCSVLAVDALTEAIYDYLSKNKLPISEKLVKEHERIQNTLEMVEERHDELIKLEDKILKEKK
jgi:nitrogen fixation NifU-like protein